MWFPDSPSWNVARNAYAGDTESARWNTDVMQVAVDNAIEVEVLAGRAGAGPRVTLGVVPWRSLLWLTSYFREGDEYAREEFLFAEQEQAREWAALRIPEIIEDEWDWGEEHEGWPPGPGLPDDQPE